MRVLAGDIGGTKTLLQIADIFPNTFRIVYEQVFESPKYPDLLPLAKEFLKSAAGQVDLIISSACFGVAGPVDGHQARTTNLPWRIDARVLAKELKISNVTLINDFQAIGYGIEGLGAQDLVTLQEGKKEKHGARVVIGAGTGLGEGILLWQDNHYQILASEGGHADFAPTDELQIDLLRYLMTKFPRVTYERVLSGSGLMNIYEFLSLRHPGVESPELKDAMTHSDPAAVISHYALDKNDALAAQALELFCSVYGAQAGNLALTCLASGGVYVAGGIAPKIIAKLKEGGFLRAFRNKGRMTALLDAMPVRVIMDPKVGVIGAALVASRMVNGK